MPEAPTPCLLCKTLAKRVAELEGQVEDLTQYAGRLHDELNAKRGNHADVPSPGSDPTVH
jgi:hypothetical protein